MPSATISKCLSVFASVFAFVSGACAGSTSDATGDATVRVAAASVDARAIFTPVPTPSAAFIGAPTVASSAAPAAPPRVVREPTAWEADLGWSAEKRLAHAKETRGEDMKALFAAAEVSLPPHELLFRVFKKEAEFEVWAANKGEPLRLLATWGVCAASGELGPKRAQGDWQVPEGYYQVAYYYPMSPYYLSAYVSYPNASDRKRGAPDPGNDILIHGRCASVGCISMTDERIEEIYWIGWQASVAKRPTHIHIFPARDMDALLRDDARAQHHAFWREIQPGLDAFERTHRLPKVTIERDGRYSIEAVE